MTATEATTEMFPLSPQQRHTWRTQVVSTGAGDGCPAISAEIAIRGPLDRGRLGAALHSLVEDLEILRTDYRHVAGLDVPLQRIGAASAVVIEDVTGDGRRSARGEPLDPACPPLRVGLARRDDRLHTLFLRLPSLNADAESVALLVERLAGLYGGTAPADVDEQPPQYADVAEWFNQRIGDADAESRRHWQSLADIRDDLPRLPFQYSRADRASRPAGEDTVSVPLPDGLGAAAGRDGGTVRGVLLASWAALLGRYSPGRPLVALVSRSGRHEAEVADAIGPLARRTPVRVDDDPSVSLRSLVARARAQDDAAEALQYDFAPESWLAGDSQAQERTSIGFTHRLAPRAVQADDIEFELIEIDAALETDLELAVEQGDASLRAEIRYRTDAFDRADLAELAAGLGSVVATWLSDPEKPADEVPLLPTDRPSPAARHDGGEPVPVHERFARHAREHPSAVAVVDHRGRHSYGALYATAHALAVRLVERGAGPGSLVGVLFGRSAAALAAMMAVLETGAAYVPLDPALPPERLRLMADDSGVEIVITQSAHASLSESLRKNPIVVDDLSSDAGPGPAADVPSGSAGLAYVLYTSGTTGRPKGVLVGHRQIAEYVDAITDRLGLEPGLGYAHVSTLAADLGYTVLFPALCTGGTLHLVDDDVLRSGDELADHLQREAVDVVKMTPSHLTTLLQTSANPAGLMPRRALVLGGELLRRDLAARLEELADGCAIVNHYGPTEATVGTTAYRVRTAGLDPRSGSVPIGTPLGAATVRVVDKALQEVPRWVPGELVIGGPGVAGGYLGLPELTAERFVPDPRSPRPDGRRYRTGDLVRKLPGGDLEFVGRNDDQVKISGYRVELGEIESTLRTHPDVRDCVALVTAEDAGDQRLVAFVTGAGDLHETELYRFAETRLPHYMRPAAIVALEAFPLTGNGKLDRAALVRAAADVQPSGDQREIPPRDGVELLVSDLWRQSLGRIVGVTDDFFEVGGNSLKAIRLIAAIRQATGISLPVSAMVDASSIEAMAELLRTEERAEQFRSAVPLQAAGSLSPFFCVHAGGGGVLSYLPLARAAGDERPFIGLQSPGLYPGGTSPAELTEMAARYVAEIKAHQPQGPYWLGGWCLGGIIAHEVARQLAVAGDDVAQLVLFDSDAPVDAPLDELAGDRPLDAHADVTDTELVQRFAWHYQLDIPTSELESLDAEARLDHLVELVRSKDLLPAGAGRAELRQLLTVYRGNVSAAMRYIRETPPPLPPSADYPVTLFLATDEEVRDNPGETLGWACIYGSRVRVEPVPGDHHTMMVPPQAGVLAQRLSALLNEAGSTGERADDR